VILTTFLTKGKNKINCTFWKENKRESQILSLANILTMNRN